MQEVLGKVSLYKLFELWSQAIQNKEQGVIENKGERELINLSSLPSLIKASCCHGLIIFTNRSMGWCHGSIFTDYSTGC
jgi:hypothetical protein